jgi:hypothetical protein
MKAAMVPRDQLIADWQNRLAAAGHVRELPSSRAAWLARLRQRLYRFLLSLYGDGHWNVPGQVDTQKSPGGSDSVVHDAPGALPLAGKPAKSDDTIRSVLDAVASANDEKQAQGPLAGLTNRKLVVIVTARSGLDLVRCNQLLISEGIIARWGSWSGFEAIYVPDVQALKARSTIQAYVPRLRLPPPAPIPKPSPAIVWGTVGIAFAPIVAAAAILFTTWTYPDAAAKGQLPEAILYGVAVFLVLLSILYVRPIGWLIQRIDRLACKCAKAAHAILPLVATLSICSTLVMLFVVLTIRLLSLERAAIVFEPAAVAGSLFIVITCVVRLLRGK